MLLQSLLRPVLTPLMRGMFDAPIASATAWSPLALWPNGASSPGLWISPRTLTSEWQDYTGTTPVATPGTVADSSNPVGLALDIRAGNPVPLGPELVVNGDFSDGTTGFTAVAGSVLAVTAGVCRATVTPGTGDAGFTFNLSAAPVVGRTYEYTFSIQNISGFSAWVFDGPLNSYVGSGPGVFTFKQVAVTTNTLMYLRSAGGGATGSYIEFDNISVKEVPGNHMLQSTSVDRPLLSAYDGQTLGPGDTYDGAGYPVFQKYNGTNSGMATAAFSAGTLTSGMDCMIAVRRDSAAATYLISDTGSRGFFEWESGNSGRPDVGAGTPTYYVDGVAITATKGALFTALTAGDWHILEARGLDLSTWTKVEVSSLVSYRLNGARGDIMLYPSTASTEDKDAARQWLADYYGVTLP